MSEFFEGDKEQPLDKPAQPPDTPETPELQGVGDTASAVNPQVVENGHEAGPRVWGDEERRPDSEQPAEPSILRPEDVSSCEFGVERFANEVPTPEDIRYVRSLYDRATLEPFRKYGEYAKIYSPDPDGSRTATVKTKYATPHGWVSFSPDLKEVPGIRITDSFISVPESVEAGAEAEGQDWRLLYVTFMRPDGSKTNHIYYEDEEGSVRRRDVNGEVLGAGVPEPGEVSEKELDEALRQRSEEVGRNRKDMEQAYEITYPRVGRREIEYLMGMADKAELAARSFQALSKLTDRRICSPPITKKDSENGAREFTRAIGVFLRSHGHDLDPLNPQEAIEEMPVVDGDVFMEVKAGEIRDPSTRTIVPSVRIQVDYHVPMEVLRATYPHVEKFKSYSPIEPGITHAILEYKIFEGELWCRLTQVSVDKEGEIIHQEGGGSARADTREALEIGRFLKNPAIRRRPLPDK